MPCRHILEFQQFGPGADLFFGSIRTKTTAVFDRYAAAEDAADMIHCLFNTGDAGYAEGDDGLSAMAGRQLSSAISSFARQSFTCSSGHPLYMEQPDGSRSSRLVLL